MFREAPFNSSQHSRGSLIKFVHLDHLKVRQIWFVCFWVVIYNIQDYLFFHCSVCCSVNEDGDKINLDQLFSNANIKHITSYTFNELSAGTLVTLNRYSAMVRA